MADPREAKDPKEKKPDPQAPIDIEGVFGQFEQLFGEFFASTPGTGAADIRVDLALSDAEASTGVTRDVAITRQVACSTCEGRGGATASDQRVPCKPCKGNGRTQQAQGFFMIQATCGTCKGAGGKFAKPCRTCDGAGSARTPHTLSVVVPAGVTHGQILRLPDAGSTIDGKAGHVYVYLLVGNQPDARAVAFDGIPAAAALPRAQLVAPPRAPMSRMTIVLIAAACVVVLGVIVRSMMMR